MSAHDHVLVTELLGYILWRTSAHFYPNSGEKSARTKYEQQVENSVKRVCHQIRDRARRRHVIRETSNRVELARIAFELLPGTEERDEGVRREPTENDLTDKEILRDECRLENDGYVASVEQLDWVSARGASLILVLYCKVYAESLEEDDDEENDGGSEQVGNIRELLSVECFLQCSDFVSSSD